MAEKIHDQDLSNKLDAFLNAGCDFARAWFKSWLASRDDQAETRAGAVEVEKTPAQSDDGGLLTTTQLAKRLNYSTRTIQQFKIEGMPFVGEGRSTRFELSKALEWLKQRPRKNNSVSTAGNGRIAKAPIKTRLRVARLI